MAVATVRPGDAAAVGSMPPGPAPGMDVGPATASSSSTAPAPAAVQAADKEALSKELQKRASVCLLPQVQCPEHKAASVAWRNRFQQSLLFFAAKRLDRDGVPVCRHYLDLGIPVDHADTNGQTALFYAASKGTAETVRLLVEHRAAADHVDKNGQTALFFAARDLNAATAAALLDSRADPARLDLGRKTPLFYAVGMTKDAASRATLPVVSLLLERRAPADVQDVKGMTAADYGSAFAPTDVIKALLTATGGKAPEAAARPQTPGNTASRPQLPAAAAGPGAPAPRRPPAAPAPSGAAAAGGAGAAGRPRPPAAQTAARVPAPAAAGPKAGAAAAAAGKAAASSGKAAARRPKAAPAGAKLLDGAKLAAAPAKREPSQDELKKREVVRLGFEKKAGFCKRLAERLEEGVFRVACPHGQALTEGSEAFKEYKNQYKRLSTHLRQNESLAKRLKSGDLDAERLASMPDQELMAEERKEAISQFLQEGLREALGERAEDAAHWTPTRDYTCPQCTSSECLYLQTWKGQTEMDDNNIDPTISIRCKECSFLWNEESVDGGRHAAGTSLVAPPAAATNGEGELPLAGELMARSKEQPEIWRHKDRKPTWELKA